MNIIEIDNIKDKRIIHYCNLTDAQLRAGFESEAGVFIAESPKVIRLALEHGWNPVSMLCERKHILGDASELIPKFDSCPIYTGEREILESITGYRLTRGVLAVFKRKMLPSVAEICESAKIVAIIQGVCDTTNIGAIFRSASALGVDAVILSADSCDPLNRRAVRVSMGTIFTVPWTITSSPLEDLHGLGFKIAALALKENAIKLDSSILKKEPRLGVMFGTEGEGLPDKIIDKCDHLVIIPMNHGVDSLNVAAASAVTFWELCKNR